MILKLTNILAQHFSPAKCQFWVWFDFLSGSVVNAVSFVTESVSDSVVDSENVLILWDIC